MKTLKNVGKKVGEGAWRSLVDPTVSRGKTAWPKTKSELESVGIRFDYDGAVKQNGIEYHKYQVQPNAGKIPASLKEWRDKHGGTHSVITNLLIKKGSTKAEVVAAVDKAMDDVKA